jgi:hypothetical protein
MRVFVRLMLVGALALPALAAPPGILVGNNPDVNNGGLISFAANQPTMWVLTGSSQQGIQNNDRLGPDASDMRVGNDWPGEYEQWYTQQFAVDPGTYDIHVEGWTKVWSGGWTGDPYEMEAHLTLLVDGSPVWTSPNATWDTWVLQSNDLLGVAVGSSVGVQLHAKAMTGTEPWAHARFDDVVLNVTPEPASLLLLGLPLVFLRRRR